MYENIYVQLGSKYVTKNFCSHLKTSIVILRKKLGKIDIHLVAKTNTGWLAVFLALTKL